jgi:ATP-dependent Lon protease
MKESAVIALEYIKANGDKFGIKQNDIEESNFHIHVPEGATPKDGPSAGVTMITALASSITGKKVKKYLAMTGEITLRGEVLAIGGVKEKILAAKRAGIRFILLPEANQKDVNDIKKDYLKGLTFNYVKKMEDVINYALT